MNENQTPMALAMPQAHAKDLETDEMGHSLYLLRLLCNAGGTAIPIIAAPASGRWVIGAQRQLEHGIMVRGRISTNSRLHGRVLRQQLDGVVHVTGFEHAESAQLLFRSFGLKSKVK